MTRSMTGFARNQTAGEWGELVWELRSVNHRYLDMSLRLPEALRALEPAVREAIGQKLSRGKVEVGARLRTTQAGQTIDIDPERLAALAHACSTIRQRMPDTRPADALHVLTYPGVLREPEPDTHALHRDALAGLDQALQQLQAMRENEGARLAGLVAERARGVAEHADAAAARLPKVRGQWLDKLRARVVELGVDADPARLEQELAIIAQRMDVSEELERLHSHIAALEATLHKSQPTGRRLDFLIQEFNREANTLASKSQDAALTACAVDMKVLIEQMREQVQNIE